MTTSYDDISYNEEQDSERKPFELHPRGSCKAVCVDVIDLGKQPNMFKKDEKTGEPVMQRRVRIVWETSRKRADGRQFTISKSYNLKLYDGTSGGNQSALYAHLASWLGPDFDGVTFDAKKIVGRAAEIYIEHEAGRKDKTKTYAKVLAVNPLDGEDFAASGSYKRYVPKEGAKQEGEEEEEPNF